MAYDGNGNYIVPAGTAAVNGQIIDPTKYNAFLTDLQAALTKGFLRDGQSAALANLPMGGFKLTGLAAGATNGDAVRYEQLATIEFTPAGTGAVATTVQDELRNRGRRIVSYGGSKSGDRKSVV